MDLKIFSKRQMNKMCMFILNLFDIFWLTVYRIKFFLNLIISLEWFYKFIFSLFYIFTLTLTRNNFTISWRIKYILNEIKPRERNSRGFISYATTSSSSDLENISLSVSGEAVETNLIVDFIL